MGLDSQLLTSLVQISWEGSDKIKSKIKLGQGQPYE